MRSIPSSFSRAVCATGGSLKTVASGSKRKQESCCKDIVIHIFHCWLVILRYCQRRFILSLCSGLQATRWACTMQIANQRFCRVCRTMGGQLPYTCVHHRTVSHLRSQSEVAIKKVCLQADSPSLRSSECTTTLVPLCGSSAHWETLGTAHFGSVLFSSTGRWPSGGFVGPACGWYYHVLPTRVWAFTGWGDGFVRSCGALNGKRTISFLLAEDCKSRQMAGSLLTRPTMSLTSWRRRSPRILRRSWWIIRSWSRNFGPGGWYNPRRFVIPTFHCCRRNTMNWGLPIWYKSIKCWSMWKQRQHPISGYFLWNCQAVSSWLMAILVLQMPPTTRVKVAMLCFWQISKLSCQNNRRHYWIGRAIDINGSCDPHWQLKQCLWTRLRIWVISWLVRLLRWPILSFVQIRDSAYHWCSFSVGCGASSKHHVFRKARRTGCGWTPVVVPELEMGSDGEATCRCFDKDAFEAEEWVSFVDAKSFCHTVGLEKCLWWWR